MGTSPKVDAIKNEEGKVPAFAWPGGYVIVYICADGAEMCADCVNGENGSEVPNMPHNSDCREDQQWDVIDYSPFHEGPPINCSHCGKEIESDYGIPEGDTGKEGALGRTLAGQRVQVDWSEDKEPE